MAQTTVHGTLRFLGRLLIIWSLAFAAILHFDAALYILVLGAVCLWQGGFDFKNMGTRYR